MVEITAVHPHSRGEKAGIREGDILMSLNGHAVTDVLDYRFYLADRHLTVALRRGGAPLTVVCLYLPVLESVPVRVMTFIMK